MPATLSISIVTFHTPLATLSATLGALATSVGFAQAAGWLGEVDLSLIDNSADGSDAREIYARASAALGDCDLCVHIRSGHGNVGYGAAHNRVLLQRDADFHLVLNPDCQLDLDALSAGVRYMLRTPDIALVSPRGRDSLGEWVSLAKARPTLGVLVLRAIAPTWLRARFQAKLDAYEYRPTLAKDNAVPAPIACASGACMLIRHAALRAVGGFDEAFFLHFEDVDLSLRLAEHGRLIHLPYMRVVHDGGNAFARSAHRWPLVRNSVRFFGKWGWRARATQSV